MRTVFVVCDASYQRFSSGAILGVIFKEQGLRFLEELLECTPFFGLGLTIFRNSSASPRYFLYPHRLLINYPLSSIGIKINVELTFLHRKFE